MALKRALAVQQEDKTVITSHPEVKVAPAPSGAETDSLVGKVLGGRYKIIRTLGAGGMGTVYEGQHEATQAVVAIKVIPFTTHDNDEVLQRFKQEAKILAGLNHQNIVSVKVIDVDTALNRCFLVMEYLQGNNLFELLRREGTPDKKRFTDLFIAAASGLGHAHSNGVVHRDVKPGNLMVIRQDDGTDLVKVLDFGISKMLGQQQMNTQTGAVLGSPSYMSPEQFYGSQVDQRTDVYALGCVMYQAITGKPPFTGRDAIEIAAQHVKDPLPEITNPELKEFEPVIAKATAKNADDRYQSMDELIHALKFGEAQTKRSANNTRTFGKSQILVILSIVLAIMAISFTLIFWTPLRESGPGDLPYAVALDTLVETVQNRQEPSEAIQQRAHIALDKTESELPANKHNWRNAKELWRAHEAFALIHQMHGNSAGRDDEFKKAIHCGHDIAHAAVCGVAMDWAHCLMSDGKNAEALEVLEREIKFLRKHPQKKQKMREGLAIAKRLAGDTQLSTEVDRSKGEFLPNGNIIHDKADGETLEAAVEKVKNNQNWSEIYLD